jgi:pyruvate dehydrogenase E1 component beta subunit
MAEIRDITFREAITEALREEMARDPRILIMGEDIIAQGGVFGVHAGLDEAFPGRLLQTPIAEAGFVGMGVGAAIAGGPVVCEVMFADFMTCCMDEIINQAAKFRYMSGGQADVPLVVRAPCGMGRGVGAQHTQSIEAIFAHVPGLLVAIPGTPAAAKGLLKTALRGSDPVVFLEYKGLYGMKGPVSDDPDLLIPFGRASIERAGGDVTVVASGTMLHRALEAAGQLAEEGVEAEVIDPRTAWPIDFDLIIESVNRTNRLVVVDEATKECSLASEIAATVGEQAFYALDAPVRRVASPHMPKPFSPKLEPVSIPQTPDIVAAIRSVLS